MPKELASRLDARAMLMLRPDVQSWSLFEKAFQEANRIPYFVGSKDAFQFLKSGYAAIYANTWGSLVWYGKLTMQGGKIHHLLWLTCLACLGTMFRLKFSNVFLCRSAPSHFQRNPNFSTNPIYTPIYHIFK